MKAWRKHMPKRPPCHSHSSTATMIGCHHTAISTVTHNIAAHKHTHTYKCKRAHRHTTVHTHRRTHAQDLRLWKSAPSSTTLTTKSLLSLQLFLHCSLTTHQKSLSLWEQHETTASSPLDATCHIKYLIICYSIFPIKLEMFAVQIHTINLAECCVWKVRWWGWSLCAEKDRINPQLQCCPTDSEEAEVHLR